MQQNYHQSLLQRPHPPVEQATRPPQARIRPRKAARGDHPPVEQATRPGSALSWQGYCFGYAVQVEKSLSPRRKL